MINSNDAIGSQKETIEDMRKESERLNFKYVSDQNHEIMEALEVTKNPEVVVIQSVSGGYKKVYQGSIDDSPMDTSSIKEDYLRVALENLVQGKPSPIQKTHPVGCRIR